MAGRNDRRRAANLRSARGNTTRSNQTSRTAGTSRPTGSARSSSRSRTTNAANTSSRDTRSSRNSRNTRQREDERTQRSTRQREGERTQRSQRTRESERSQSTSRERTSRERASREKTASQRTSREQTASKRTSRERSERPSVRANERQQRATRDRENKEQRDSKDASSKRSLLANVPFIGSRSKKSRELADVPSPIDDVETERANATATAGGKTPGGPRLNIPEITVERGGQKPGASDEEPLPSDEEIEEAAGENGEAPEDDMVSTSVAQLRRADRMERAKKNSRRYLIRIVGIIGVFVALLAGWAALYNSPAFSIQNVEVNGVEHLTSEEMATLANVPTDTTLLRVDTATIENRVEQNSWVADASVVRVFPNTLQINVTERQVYAVVEIPTTGMTAVKQWAISDDHLWLMPIPDADSEAAKTTSSKVYEDAQKVLHIINLPIGTKAEIGKECVDANVNNALDVVSGLTTDLSKHVAEVSAAGIAETTLILDNGIEIAFGKAEDIRDKERVILQILDEHPNNVAYINVRMPETPTWRAV